MRNLLQLLNDNRKRGSMRIDAAAKNAAGETVVTVYLYDYIIADAATAEWWGGIAAETFVPEFRAIEADIIHLRINSPGGDVFAARAIEQAVRDHPATVIVHIDGYAASAATYVALAGDEVVIGEGAMFMIHCSWTFAYGNAMDLLETAALLEKVDGTIADTYAKKTGKPADEMLALMKATTWFTGKEAVEIGFADRLAEEEEPKDSASWNLSAYGSAPKQAAPPAAPRAPKAERTPYWTEKERAIVDSEREQYERRVALASLPV